MASQLPRGYKSGTRKKRRYILFFLKLLDDSDPHLCLNLLAEVPHAHSVAGSSIEEGAGGVESNLVDLTLSRRDGQTPDRGTDVPRPDLA